MPQNSLKSAVVWSKNNCQACETVKDLLAQHKYAFEIISVDTPHGLAEFRKQMPTARSVPQVYIEDQYVGGLQEVKKFLAE